MDNFSYLINNLPNTNNISNIGTNVIHNDISGMIHNIESNCNINVRSCETDNEDNEKYKFLYDLKRQLTPLLYNQYKKEEVENSEEVIKHKQIVEDIKQKNKEISLFLLEQIKKVNILEETYKKELQKIKDNLNKINDFIDFILKINKYENINIDKLVENIKELSEEINKDTTHEQVQKEYIKELHILHYYIENHIKDPCRQQTVSTCTLCLQNQVDRYFDPCGHTICEDCEDKLKDRSINGHIKCFLCRENILASKKIYFS